MSDAAPAAPGNNARVEAALQRVERTIALVRHGMAQRELSAAEADGAIEGADAFVAKALF